MNKEKEVALKLVLKNLSWIDDEYISKRNIAYIFDEHYNGNSFNALEAIQNKYLLSLTKGTLLIDTNTESCFVMYEDIDLPSLTVTVFDGLTMYEETIGAFAIKFCDETRMPRVIPLDCFDKYKERMNDIIIERNVQ